MTEPGSSTKKTSGRGRSGAYVILALVFGVGLFTLAIRRVNWAAFASALAGVSWPWLAAATVMAICAQSLSAYRWCVLVNAPDELPYADAFDFSMIGSLAGLAVSGRLGDLARAMAAGRFRSLSASRLLGTILVERLFDVLMLLTFGVSLALLMDIPPLVRAALLSLLVAALVLSAVLWMGQDGPLGIVSRLLARWLGAESRVLVMFTRFVEGISAVRHQGRALPALGIALLVWLSSALSVRFSLAAFGLPVPWYAGAFVVIVVNLGGLVPAPPAGLGVYDYLAMLALSPWVADSSAAFAFALVNHAIAVTLTASLGGISLVRKGLSIGKLRKMAEDDTPDSRVG